MQLLMLFYFAEASSEHMNMGDKERCFFKCNRTDKLITGGAQRINSIIEASITRQDTLHLDLRKKLDDDPSFSIKYHSSCVSTYTSKTHIQRELKRLGSSDPHKEKPKKRRS